MLSVAAEGPMAYEIESAGDRDGGWREPTCVPAASGRCAPRKRDGASEARAARRGRQTSDTHAGDDQPRRPASRERVTDELISRARVDFKRVRPRHFVHLHGARRQPAEDLPQQQHADRKVGRGGGGGLVTDL